MTDRKMTEEEVFVSAMNAAISGLMAAKGGAIFEKAKYDKRAYGSLSDAISEITFFAEVAFHVGCAATKNWNEFCEESET